MAPRYEMNRLAQLRLPNDQSHWPNWKERHALTSQLPPIFLHVPKRVRWLRGTPMGTFYLNLIQQFMMYDVHFKYDVFPQDIPDLEDGSFHICYHTNVNHPMALNLKGSHLDGFFLCDPSGYSGWSNLSEMDWSPQDVPLEEALRFHDWLQTHYVNARVGRWEKEALAADIPADAIVIFLQKPKDRVMQLARFNMQEMVGMVLQECSGRPVLIKRHPECEDADLTIFLGQVLQSHPNVQLVSDSIYRISAAVDHVICANSSTGYQAALSGAHVLSFGQSDYSQITTQISHEAELAEALSMPPKDLETRAKFFYWHLRKRSLFMNGLSIGRELLERIGQQISVPLARPTIWNEVPPPQSNWSP